MSTREIELIKLLGIDEIINIVNNRTGPIYNVDTKQYSERNKQLSFNSSEYFVDELYYSCVSFYLGLNRPLTFLEKRSYGQQYISLIMEGIKSKLNLSKDIKNSDLQKKILNSLKYEDIDPIRPRLIEKI